MAMKKQEFYMSVKAILDKASVKEDAKELQELLSKTELDFSSEKFEKRVKEVVSKMSKETMTLIGQGFNKAFALLGKNPINLEDMITIPNEQMWEKMGQMAGQYYAQGLQDAISNIDSSAFKGIETSLNNIADKFDNVINSFDSGIKKASKGALASVSVIDKAIGKLGNSYSKIQETLDFKSKGTIDKRLETLHNMKQELQTSLDSKDWIKRQESIIKYTRAYEDYYNRLPKKERQYVDQEYSNLYNKVLPESHDAKINFQNIINRREGRDLVGGSEPWAREDTLKEVRDILKGGIDINDKTSKNNAPPKPPKLDGRSNPKEKGVTVYRVIEEDDSKKGLTRQEVLKNRGGGEYWSDKADVAHTYASHNANNVTLKGVLRPQNPLVIDGGGHQWSQLNLISDFKKYFPELMEQVEVAVQNKTYDAEYYQKKINVAAKEQGYDSIILKNIIDTFDPKSYSVTGTAYTVLSDQILEVVGAALPEYSNDSEGVVFSHKYTKDGIPDYYQMPKHSDSMSIDTNKVEIHADAVNKNKELTNNVDIKEPNKTTNDNGTMVDFMSKYTDLSRYKTVNITEEADNAVKNANATEREAEAEKKITEEKKEQQKLMLYRRGKTTFKRDKFRNTDMLGNLIFESNQMAYDDEGKVAYNGAIPLGFGGAGDGLWCSVAGVGAQDLNMGDLSDDEHYFEIPADKYDLFTVDTVDYAKQFLAFTDKMQKFILAAGEFRGYDDELNGVDEDTLFNSATQIFERFNMSKEEFASWINKMQSFVKNLGLNKDGIFTSIDEKTMRSHNFATRFMQTMGYDGVLSNTGNEDYDGNYLGSVIYNPNFDEIENHINTSGHTFNTEEEYVSYLDAIETKQQAIAKSYIEMAKAKDVAFKKTSEEKKKEPLLLDIYAKNPDVYKDKLQNVLNENPGIIEDYTAKRDDLQSKMQSVQDATGRISKNSSVAKVPYSQLREEIIKTGKELSTMYDAGITDTEEYITLQYKLIHLLDKDIKAYGTVKSAGAKDKNQLKNWQRDSILQETGYDVYSAFDALREGKNSILDNNTGKQRTMRDVASQLVGYKGFADIDAIKLADYKTIIDGLTQVQAEMQSAKVATDALTDSFEKQQQQIENVDAPSNNVPEVETTPVPQDEGGGQTAVSFDVNALREILSNITYGVKIVQDAPENEKKVSIDIDGLKSVLGAITYNVKNVSDVDNKQTVAIDETALESVLSRVFSNIINSNTQQNDSDETVTKDAPWARETTLESVKGVLDAIKVNTTNTNVNQTVNIDDGVLQNIENILTAIKDITNKIDNKLVKGTKVRAVDTGAKEEKERKQVQESATKDIQAKYTKLAKYEVALQNSEEGSQVYDDAQKNINVLKQEIDLIKEKTGLSKEELENIHTLAKEEEERAEASRRAQQADKEFQKSQNKSLQDKIKEFQKENSFNKINSAERAGRDALWSVGAMGESSADIAKMSEVNGLSASLQKLTDIKERIAKINADKGVVSPQEIDDLNKATQEVVSYTTAVKELVANYERFSDTNSISMNATLGDGNVKEQLLAAAKAAFGASFQYKEFDEKAKELHGTVKSGAHEFTDYTIGVRNATNQIRGIQGVTKKTETFMESFKRKLGEIFRYFSASSLIFKAFNELRKGIQYVREIDSALTELKKVTDETEETYDKFLDTASKTAAKVGSTIKEVVSSTADFARLGYTLKEAAVFAESAQILMNVSEFTDVSRATDTLISAVQAFGYTAETSMEVVDLLNMIGNNYAISTADLAQSLTKSSASLVAAGGNLAEAAALTATANKIIQDADSVGTALKTTSLRLRGTSVDILNEEGLDSEGAVTSKSKLQSKVKALSGVDILTQTGEYKSTYEILSQIADVWEDISDMDQAALLELISGKRNSSVIAAILQNPTELKAAFEDASNAAGSALKENEKYLDSIQGRIDLFTNSVQTMWNNALDSDAVKWFVDFGTTLVKIIDDLGLIQTLFIGIGTYLMKKYDLTGAIGGFFDSKTINKATERLDLEDQLNAAIGDLDALKTQSGSVVSNMFDSEIDAASQKVDELKVKIQQNGMSIDDAKAKMKQFGDVTNETSRKGIKSWDNLKTKAKKFGAQLKDVAKSMAIMYAITVALELVGDLFGWLKDITIDQIETAEKAQEKFEELNSELSTVQSELNSLNSELENTQDRIDELLAQGSLSFTEQEELDRLRAENAELERKIALNKTLEESLQKSTNAASVHATDMYLDTSFGSELSKTERQEEASEKYGKWGKYGGAAVGAAIGAFLGPAGALIGGLIGAGIGAFVGEPIGEAIGSAVEGAAYDSEQTVEQAMDNMVSQRAKLKKNQDDALTSGDTEAYKNATEALQMYDKQMAQHITKIQEQYNAMDWDTATTEEKKKMMDYADWLDKYSIAMGTTNAKSNAITRIFGEEADTKLKGIKADIEAAMNAAKDDGTDPNFDFQAVFNADGMEEFRQRLYDMGLTVTDIKYYFLDLAKAEKEAEESYDTYDTVKQMNTVAGGINALKDAFGEITEEGQISTSTLVELEETFGGLGDSWSNFVDTVATGTGSIKEATEAITELVEAYLTQQLSQGPMTAEERIKTIIMLQQMGVKNAQEYVDAMTRAAVAQEVGSKVNKDNETKTQLSQEIADLDTKINDPNTSAEDKEKYKTEKATKQGELDALNTKTSAEDYVTNYIEEVEKTYGITLTDKEKELLIEKAITAEKAKQNALNIQAQKTAYDTAVREREEAEEINKDLDDRIAKAGTASLEELGVEKKRKKGSTGWWYNGVKYTTPESARNAVIADLTSQKVEVPELPVEVTEVDVTNANEAAETAENEFNTALDDIGLSVDIVLADPSDLVDKVQNVFDTLKNAVNEYNENGGKLSVDTLQSLLDLEPQYLALLYDEKGQLKLNQDAILAVSEARIRDMGLQRAQAIIDQVQNALNEDKIDRVYELTTANHGLAKSTWDVVEGNMATVASLMATKGMSEDAINSFTGLIKGIKNSTEGAIADLPNTLSTSGNTAAAETEDAIQKLIDYYSNRLSANQAKQEQIQNEIDLAEQMGMKADKSYYDEKIKLMEEQEALLQQKKADLLVELSKVTEGSDEWWEISNELNDVESELDDVTSSIVDMQDAIGEIDKYQFDEFGKRLDKLTSKLQTMRDLMAPNGDEDWFDDEGGFTEKGTAVLGSYLQELEIYKQGLAQVESDMAEFGNKSYHDLTQEQRDSLAERGIHSEQEYYDWVTSLDDAQLNYLSNISSTETAIADMYESSIDAVEEYTQTLVESYNDYIDACKEALDAERDLYDFKKNIQKQNKDIASTERRIAALSGSTNSSDIAERRKLEAQLLEQRESLDDTYYQHSKESQQSALDAEAQAYEESMNRFVENLRISLDTALGDMEAFLGGVSASVMLNAQIVKDEYANTGVTLDDALVQPWDDAIAAIGTYETDGLSRMNAWTTDSGFFGQFSEGAKDKLTGFWGDGIQACDGFKTSINNVLTQISTSISTNVAKWREDISTAYADVQDSAANPPSLVNQGTVANTPSKALHEKGEVKNAWYQVENAEGMLANSIDINGVKYYKAPDGYYYKFSERRARKDVQGKPGYAYPKGTKYYSYYAKGTLGTKQSGFAITDESWIGEEITLAAGKNGSLQYLKRGSAVLPADISANLIEWGKLNPNMLNMTNPTGVNIISNAIIQPNYDFKFDSLVHVDHCDQNTVKDLERMVDNKLNDFGKQLNYSIKKFTR